MSSIGNHLSISRRNLACSKANCLANLIDTRGKEQVTTFRSSTNVVHVQTNGHCRNTGNEPNGQGGDDIHPSGKRPAMNVALIVEMARGDIGVPHDDPAPVVVALYCGNDLQLVNHIAFVALLFSTESLYLVEVVSASVREGPVVVGRRRARRRGNIGSHQCDCSPLFNNTSNLVKAMLLFCIPFHNMHVVAAMMIIRTYGPDSIPSTWLPPTGGSAGALVR